MIGCCLPCRRGCGRRGGKMLTGSNPAARIDTSEPTVQLGTLNRHPISVNQTNKQIVTIQMIEALKANCRTDRYKMKQRVNVFTAHCICILYIQLARIYNSY